MSTKANSRRTCYVFALVVALYGALAVGGAIVGSTMWPKPTVAISSGK
jgi:hypothetical protein